MLLYAAHISNVELIFCFYITNQHVLLLSLCIKRFKYTDVVVVFFSLSAPQIEFNQHLCALFPINIWHFHVSKSNSIYICFYFDLSHCNNNFLANFDFSLYQLNGYNIAHLLLPIFKKKKKSPRLYRKLK